MSDPVRMAHPFSRQEIEVIPAHVERYASQGWQEVLVSVPADEPTESETVIGADVPLPDPEGDAA